MRTNYILIDFENVQPKSLTQLTDHPFKVIVFVGANQSKIPIELVRMLQPLGDNVDYIQISGKGPDALDFHIAYYIGDLSAKDPKGYFHIISKDKGFDPLITHLKTKKIQVVRSVDISEIPMLKISNAISMDDRIAAVKKNLIGRGTSVPRKDTTLLNTVKSMFANDIATDELHRVIDELKKRKLVIVTDGRVSYNLKAAAK